MDPNLNNSQPLDTVNNDIPVANTVSSENKKTGFNKDLFLSKLQNKKILFAGLAGLLLIIVLVSFISTSTQNARYEDAVKIIEEAKVAYTAGDLEVVEGKLKQVLGNFPNDPAVQAALIKTIGNQGNLTGKEAEAYTKAQPYIKSALEKNPNDAEILLSAGYLEEINGNYTEALNFYDRALEINNENPQAWFNKGHVMEFMNRYEESNAAYETAYKLDPSDPLISMAKGKVLLSQNLGNEALEIYKNTANIPNISAPLKAEALTNASVLTRSNMFRFEESIAFAEQSYQADSTFSPGVGNYGFLLGVYNQEPARGEELLKKAIDLNPRITQNYWHLAALYRMQDNFIEAVRYTRLALDGLENDNTLLGAEERNKRRAAYSYDLATVYSLAGENESIMEPLTLALSIDPALKSVAQSDYEDDVFFQGLSNNPEFLNLIL